MKKNIRLKNITITDATYAYHLNDIIKEIKKFVEVDDVENAGQLFYKKHEESIRSGKFLLNIDICTCGSSQNVDRMFTLVPVGTVQKGRKKYTLNDFYIRNETINAQTLIRIRKTIMDNKGELIAKFRKDILPGLLANPSTDDNWKVTKDFYSIERAYQINIYSNEYDKKVSELLDQNWAVSEASIIMNNINNMMECDNDEYFDESNVRSNADITYRENCFMETTLMFHSEWCQPEQDGSGDVIFEACQMFSDVSIGNNFKVTSKSALNNIAKNMNDLISECSTYGASWKLIYDTEKLRHKNKDYEIMVSVEEITTKLDKQYYNLSQVITKFYQNYIIILRAIENELAYANLN